jgi:hypothetical protein
MFFLLRTQEEREATDGKGPTGPAMEFREHEGTMFRVRMVFWQGGIVVSMVRGRRAPGKRLTGSKLDVWRGVCNQQARGKLRIQRLHRTMSEKRMVLRA